MHDSVYQWTNTILLKVIAVGTVEAVLEVGALNVNGSLRPMINHLYGPTHYIGTDMQAGPGVDVPMVAEVLDAYFQPVFDLVVCTEMLEHCLEWRSALASMANCLKPNGWLLLTTRGPGFPRHDYPADYWRFPVDTMDRILRALNLDGVIEPDHPSTPGVLCLVQKRGNYVRTEEDIPEAVEPERVP